MRIIFFIGSCLFVFTQPTLALGIALAGAVYVRAPELVFIGALVDIFFGIPGTIPYATIGVALVLWGMEPLRKELAGSS